VPAALINVRKPSSANTSLFEPGAATAYEEGIILPIAPPANGKSDNPLITFLRFMVLKILIYKN
jgi:hypothetical protein